MRDAPISRAWCGMLAVPRDWSASVGLDEQTGLGWAGGYWLGVKAMYGLHRAADRREGRGGEDISRIGRLGDKLSGRGL